MWRIKRSGSDADDVAMDLYDVYQHHQIRKNRQNQQALASQVQHQRQSDRDRDEDLRERVDRLVMLTEAMWELLRDTAGMTEDHLLHKLAEIDGLDGVSDGRRRRPPIDCECGAKVAVSAKVCVFCGAPPDTTSAFDWV